MIEITRNVGKWGNSAGILLPKEWLGNQVKVILIERTSEIKKEVLTILENYLEELVGVYIVGSYARGEQDKESDIDILAISKSLSKEIVSGKYHVSIAPLEKLKKTLEKNPILILPRILEAKPILNSSLTDELKSIKVSKSDFSNYIEETKRIIEINKKLLEKEDKEVSPEIVYSLVLRLRGICIIKSILKNKLYSKTEFQRELSKIVKKDEIEKVYNIYRAIRDNKKTKIKIKTEIAKNLLDFLEKEINNYSKW